MISPRVDNRFTQLPLSLVSSAFLLTEVGASERCLSHVELRELALQMWDCQDQIVLDHLDYCPRCAHTFMVFRGLHAARTQSPNWSTAVAAEDAILSLRDRACQLFGHLSIEQGVITWCQEEDWLRSPRHLRITLVLDSLADTVGLTLADTLTTFKSVALSTPNRVLSLEAIDDLEMFHSSTSLTAFTGRCDPEEAAQLFLDWLRGGDLTLDMEIEPAHGAYTSATRSVLPLLREASTIEREFDYELPSGLHCDTHINVGKICRSEEHLHCIASALDALFADCHFDTILTNGWAMATIARRLSAIRSDGSSSVPIDTIMCEDYQKIVLASDIPPQRAVLILVDVNVTGNLVNRMREAADSVGATVVGIGALVQALSTASKRPEGLRTLCSISMDIVNPEVVTCPRCETHEIRVFNPVSHCMTKRAPHPRSPSDFLVQNPDALEFWEFIDLARAYEHHHREEHAHYIAFVDTRKLLEHPDVGAILIERLRDRVLASNLVPDVFLIVNRPRARLLAQMLAKSFGQKCLPKIIVARRPRRISRQETSMRPWNISDEDCDALSNRTVLVLDTAAGQGTTIDRLIQLTLAAHAAAISAAVLISRLPEGCEEAFSARLAGNFHCLHRLPIRPVVIRGSDPSICPICRRRAAIKQAGKASGVDAIEKWSLQLQYRGRRSADLSRVRAPRQEQLHLFPSAQGFLENCCVAVASGVTLHALYASMTNGMAALSLPELFNNRIPSRNRTAMVENLPQGAIDWSGASLASDLRRFLERGTAPNVWRASAEALVRDGEDVWLHQLSTLLSRLQCGQKRISPTFWNYLSCTTYAAIAQNPELKQVVRNQLVQLVDSTDDAPETKGLQRVLQTIPV